MTLLLAVTLAPAALAHELNGQLLPHDTEELWRAWPWEPVTYAALAISAVLYATGLLRTWRLAGVGHGIRRYEAGCFALGWLALAVSLVSPLHPMGQVLFSAHMIQHELMMMVAAPLLVLGRPLVAWLRALPSPAAGALARFSNTRGWRGVWGFVSAPLVAWLLHAVILWGWHAPALFQATLHSDWVHAAQHTSFLGSALLFWWALFHARRTATSDGVAVLYLFTTAVHSGFLGALLTFARSPWYPQYDYTTIFWGVSTLDDQQVGGLIMWVPACTVYVIAALALFARWIRNADRPIVTRGRVATTALVLIALATTGCDNDKKRLARALAGGDPDKGRQAIENYGCASCHTIPGIHGADALVGPPLDHMASRAYVAGVMPNTPHNLVRWIQDPPAVDDKTAMPKLGISESDARDVATYLYTLQ